jgi:citrate lyase subunit beta / citryl-CoA lyase
MKLRSLLFVPADSERKLAKGLASAADALILDLEDAVAPGRKAGARVSAAEFIHAQAATLRARLFVRINPFGSGLALDDLAAVVVPGLAGIMLPKPDDATDLLRLGHCLDALEARAGLPAGGIGILPIATETAAAMLNMNRYAALAAKGPIARLVGVTWGAEDLATAVGAMGNREDSGTYSPLFELAGSLCLCAAAAAGVPAIDTVQVDFKDMAGLEASSRNSRRRGFRGRMAIHPDQVAIFNDAYSPTADELGRAQRIVDAFALEPDAGALNVDGQMVDLPHLVQARRTLASAAGQSAA